MTAPPAHGSDMVATLAIAVAAGIRIGLSLGALGGGGSILTVPALVYLLAVEPQSATSASLIIVGITSIIAAISHARARHVRWRAAGVFGIQGSVTAFGGSILHRSVDRSEARSVGKECDSTCRYRGSPYH